MYERPKNIHGMDEPGVRVVVPGLSDPSASGAGQTAPTDPWAHRSLNMRCHSCMWYAPKAVTHQVGSQIGRCRRHAPTMSGYPVVYATDWCGDHKLDESRA